MTVHGDLAEKLDYAFDVYDLDKNRHIGFFLNYFNIKFLNFSI